MSRTIINGRCMLNVVLARAVINSGFAGRVSGAIPICVKLRCLMIARNANGAGLLFEGRSRNLVGLVKT